MKDKVLQVLQGIRPDVDFEGTMALIDDSVLGSLDVVSIVSELNDELDIDISVDDLIPENFNSVDAIVELVESMQG